MLQKKETSPQDIEMRSSNYEDVSRFGMCGAGLDYGISFDLVRNRFETLGLFESKYMPRFSFWNLDMMTIG